MVYLWYIPLIIISESILHISLDQSMVLENSG